MEITRATEYAVRCVLHLTLEPADRVVPRREIAAAREIPEQFLGKIAQRLARAGIIRILQGARGGYQLAVPADQLTLLAVVEAAEGALTLNTCVMHARACSRTCVCAVHRVWAEARRQLRTTLGAVTFAELAAQEGPLPPPVSESANKQLTSTRRRSGAEHGALCAGSSSRSCTDGVGVARRGGFHRRNVASTKKKCQPRFSGRRSDRMPNETVSSRNKERQIDVSANGRVGWTVRSVRTPQPK